MPPTDKSLLQSETHPLSPAERRRHPRFLFSASGEVVELISGIKVSGRASDLSLGGCYLDSIAPCPVGAIVKVRIEKGREILEAMARVVYSQAGMGMGMVFDTVSPNHLLQRWVLELSGKISGKLELPEDYGRLWQVPDVAANAEDQFQVLGELIIALMRAKVLTQAEGNSLLSRLHRQGNKEVIL